MPLGDGRRRWLEVLLAQAAILVITPVLAILAGAVGAVLLALLGPSDATGSGLGPAAGFVFGWLVGLPVAFLTLWGLAWALWFRHRLAPRPFLLAWTATLLLLAVLFTVTAFLRDWRA